MIDKQTREPESNIVFTTKLGVETAEEKESTESLYEELEQQLEESQSGLADYVVAFFDKAKNYRENNGIDKRIVLRLACTHLWYLEHWYHRQYYLCDAE